MKRLLYPILFLTISIISPAKSECSTKTPSLKTQNDSSYKEAYEAGYRAALNKKSSRKKERKPSRKPKIWFAEMIMRVGDNEDKIFSHLKKHYVVEKVKSDWVVRSRETGNVFGYVRFINGRLTSVARVWASLSDPEAVNMGNSLYNVLSGLTSVELKNLSITTKSTRKKSYEQNLIIFKTLNKNIRLSIYTSRKIRKVEVQEILFQEK